MASATELKDRLTPTHLIPETEEGLKEEAAIDEAPATDPRDKKEFSFPFEHTDRRGKLWQGKFTNQILSIRDRQLVGIMRARLAGGQPFEAVDPLTAEINLMVAHLTQSLTERPEWAKDLLALTDYEILQAIYLEVDSHESHFHGRRSLKESGAE